MDRNAYEAAARRLCELRGIEPDQFVGHEVEGSGMWHSSPRWWLVADEVMAYHQCAIALAECRPTATGEK